MLDNTYKEIETDNFYFENNNNGIIKIEEILERSHERSHILENYPLDFVDGFKFAETLCYQLQEKENEKDYHFAEKKVDNNIKKIIYKKSGINDRNELSSYPPLIIDHITATIINNRMKYIWEVRKLRTHISMLARHISKKNSVNKNSEDYEEIQRKITSSEKILKNYLLTLQVNLTDFDDFLNTFYAVGPTNTMGKKILKNLVINTFGVGNVIQNKNTLKQVEYFIEPIAIPIFGKIKTFKKLFDKSGNNVNKIKETIFNLNYLDKNHNQCFLLNAPLTFNATSRVDVLNALRSMFAETKIYNNDIDKNIQNEILNSLYNTIKPFNLNYCKNTNDYCSAIIMGVRIYKKDDDNNSSHKKLNELLNEYKKINNNEKSLADIKWQASHYQFLKSLNISPSDISILPPTRPLQAQSKVLALHLANELYSDLKFKNFSSINVLCFEDKQTMALSAFNRNEVLPFNNNEKVVAISESIASSHIVSMDDFVHVISYECTEDGLRTKLRE